jgi:hypothetical protein
MFPQFRAIAGNIASRKSTTASITRESIIPGTSAFPTLCINRTSGTDGLPNISTSPYSPLSTLGEWAIFVVLSTFLDFGNGSDYADFAGCRDKGR